MLTRENAAAVLGISTYTLDRLRRDGKIAYVQYVPGGKVWITEDAIREYIARSTHPVKQEAPVRETYRRRRVV